MLTLPPHSSPRFDIARASYGGSAVVHGLLTPWRENEAESVAAPSSIAVVFTWPARAWIRKGSGRAFRWQVRPGDVGLGGVQPMRWIETDNPSDFVEVAAPLELRQSVAAEFRVPQHADLVDVHGFTDPVLVAIGMRLRSALRGAAPVSALQAESLVRALYGRSLMLTLGGRNPPRAHRLSAQRLSRAIEYLSATETPSLKCMAGHAALTPFHFLRCFKRTTGLTPHEWVTLLRLDRARRLLLRGESVASVAAAVGYTNVGWFRRLFKKHYGRLPSLLDRNQW